MKRRLVHQMTRVYSDFVLLSCSKIAIREASLLPEGISAYHVCCVVDLLLPSLFVPVFHMAPFRWPEPHHDVALAIEVIAHRPTRRQDWGSIAETLSEHFSTEGRPVCLTGRACKDRLNLLLAKYRAEDAKGLKRYFINLLCS